MIKRMCFMLFLSFVLLCLVQATDNSDKKDLSVDFYPCDSLGTPKYEFLENETVIVKCVLSNQSNHIIKYRSVYDPDFWFRIEYYEYADSMVYHSNFGYFPEDSWKDYFLQPGASKIGFEKYERDHEPLQKGRYWIELQLPIDFGDQYEYLYQTKSKIIKIK